MKIHISLIGAQAIPVFLCIKESNADKIYLLHSAKTKKQAEIISKLFNKKETAQVIVNPIDYFDIENKISNILLEHENDNVSIDITGGTKIMSIVAYSFIEKCESVKYVNQNNQIFDFKTKEKKDIKIDINIPVFFELNGFPLKSYKNINDYSNEKLNGYKKVRELISFAKGEFYKLIKELSRYPDKINFTTKRGSSYKYNKEQGCVEIKLINRNKSLKKKFEFEGVHKYIINTFWFEFEVAQILLKNKEIKEIYHNVVVPYSTGEDKNEIDLVVNTGQKLLFVECKTQVNDIKDIDKFRNVVKNYGGLGAKSILITDAKVNNRVKEKCSDNNILLFSLEDARNNSFMTTEQILNNILKTELLTTNPI